MMYYDKKLSLAVIITMLLSLSACSQTTELNRLKHEYQHYSHSKYVQNNLQAHSVDLAEKQHASHISNRQHTQKLHATRRQFVLQKTRASAKTAHTLWQNNLFTPPQALRHQVTSLQASHTTEDWLKKQSSLAAVLTVMLHNNLDIQSHLQATQASLAKYDQISFLDDTLAQYAAFTKDLNVPVGKKKHNPSISAGFPFPGLLSLKASIIDQAVESSRLQLKQTVQDTLTRTRIAYYEIQLARQEIDVIAKNIRLLKSLKQQLKQSYSTNTIELSDILQVDIEIEQNRNKRQTTQNKLTAQQAQLNALLNLSATFTLGKTDPFRPVKLTKTIQELLQTGKQQRIEIVRMHSDLKKMQQIIQLSEKHFYPDFTAGYSRFQNQTSRQTGSNASKAAFSTRPGFQKNNFFGNRDAYLAETKIKYQALQTQLKALKNQTESDIQQALTRYQTQKKSHDLYQSTLIPLSKTTLEIAKNRFETGDSSYLKVTKIEKKILDYRLLSLNAIKDMNVTAAQLERITGRIK